MWSENKENIRHKLKIILDKVIYFLAPDDCNCIICDREIPRGQRLVLCDECREKLSFNDGHICIRCGKPIENEALYCNECQNNEMNFDFARSSMIYEKEVVKLITSLKFHNKKWLAKMLAPFMVDTYKSNSYESDVVVPIPISAKRMAERHYNQSEELARYIAKELDLPLVTTAIEKYKDNKPQTGVSSRDRRENVKGVYRPIDRKSVKGKRVLLVDDILTTGSTASEVARVLKYCGATEVAVLVFASPRFKIAVEPNEETTEIDYTTFYV